MDKTLTRQQVRRVDELAISEYAMPGIILMENAGRNAAGYIHHRYSDSREAIILCGPGNNGGDGCVIARHLHNCGWDVSLIVMGNRSRFSNDLETNFRICERMKLPCIMMPDVQSVVSVADAREGNAVIVDALLGTGFRGEVRGPTAGLIAMMNNLSKKAMIAVDVPSGLDCDTGLPSNATIRADLTITFVASKRGFTAEGAQNWTGEVMVADIGVPVELIDRVAVE